MKHLYLPFYSSQFKKDIKLAHKKGLDLAKLETLMDLLLSGQPLPPRYKDHALKGKWENFRDAHITPDWILIYQIDADTVYFSRAGTHSDLFKN